MKKERKIEPTVAGYIFNENDLLLIYYNERNKWLPIGNTIAENETPDDAIINGAKKGIGLDITVLKHPYREVSGESIKRNLAIPFYLNTYTIGDKEYYCLSYVCIASSRDIKIDKEEVNAVEWFSFPKLYSKEITLGVRNIASLAFSIYFDSKRHVQNYGRNL